MSVASFMSNNKPECLWQRLNDPQVVTLWFITENSLPTFLTFKPGLTCGTVNHFGISQQFCWAGINILGGATVREMWKLSWCLVGENACEWCCMLVPVHTRATGSTQMSAQNHNVVELGQEGGEWVWNLLDPSILKGHKANDQSERDSEEEIYVSKVEIKDLQNVINAWDGGIEIWKKGCLISLTN